MTNQREKIKNCPFCGGEAVIWSKKGVKLKKYIAREGFSVVCKFRYCRLWHPEILMQETKEQAIKAWNTRHSQPVIQEDFQEMQEIAKKVKQLADEADKSVEDYFKWLEGINSQPVIQEVKAWDFKDKEVIKKLFSGFMLSGSLSAEKDAFSCCPITPQPITIRVLGGH